MLYSINLSGNRIAEIPDGTFIGNQYLSAVTLAINRIQTISPRAFAGELVVKFQKICEPKRT